MHREKFSWKSHDLSVTHRPRDVPRSTRYFSCRVRSTATVKHTELSTTPTPLLLPKTAPPFGSASLARDSKIPSPLGAFKNPTHDFSPYSIADVYFRTHRSIFLRIANLQNYALVSSPSGSTYYFLGDGIKPMRVALLSVSVPLSYRASCYPSCRVGKRKRRGAVHTSRFSRTYASVKARPVDDEV